MDHSNYDLEQSFYCYGKPTYEHGNILYWITVTTTWVGFHDQDH